MENNSGIYGIINLKNNKIYIGLSTRLNVRKKSHFNALKRGNHINKYLQSAFNKYGEDAFSFIVLEYLESDKEKLKEREIYWIHYYLSNNRLFGYNMTCGGDGVRELDEDAKNRISIGRTRRRVVQLDKNGKYIATYRNAKEASVHNGIPFDKNIFLCCQHRYGCQTCYGYIWMFEEDYLKTGCDASKYVRGCFKKPIEQYDLNGNFIASYESARDAERKTGIGYKMISRVCNGERPYTHGFVFKFLN